MNFPFSYHCFCLGFWKATLTGPSHLIHRCFGPLTLYDNLITNSLSISQSNLFWTLIKWIQQEWLIDISSSYIPCFTLAATTEILFMLNSPHQKEYYLHHHQTKQPKTEIHLERIDTYSYFPCINLLTCFHTFTFAMFFKTQFWLLFSSSHMDFYSRYLIVPLTKK